MSDNRFRASRFAHSVAFYLSAFGLKAEVRKPGPHRSMSEAFAAEPDAAALETSTLIGLEKFSISTRADYRHDLSGSLNAAERDAAPGKIPAVILFRRAPAEAGSQYALVSLQSLARIARIIEGVDHD